MWVRVAAAGPKSYNTFHLKMDGQIIVIIGECSQFNHLGLSFVFISRQDFVKQLQLVFMETNGGIDLRKLLLICVSRENQPRNGSLGRKNPFDMSKGLQKLWLIGFDNKTRNKRNYYTDTLKSNNALQRRNEVKERFSESLPSLEQRLFREKKIV